METQKETQSKYAETDVLEASVRSTYEMLVLAMIALKRSKEGTQGDVGHYQMEGYKKRGIVGNFMQIDKKFESIELLCWGPDPTQPTQNIHDLELGQLKKLFDHSIDSANYCVFNAEIVRDFVLDKFDVDLLDEALAGRELA